MSDTREREEKICLNCQTEVIGRYCHRCGQENADPRESIWHIISHFFSDITHFDGKFFSTVRYLFWKPGFLSKEYLRGRRTSYLNPVRMYVFTSALFFLIFFNISGKINLGGTNTVREIANSTQESLAQLKTEALREAKNGKDSATINRIFSSVPYSSVEVGDTALKSGRIKAGFTLGDNFGKTKKEYDSIQGSLSPSLRDNWLRRKVTYRFIELSQKYKDNSGELLRDLLDKFIHTFPYLLFVSLPLFALFLKLLYIRQKQFYYVDHAIFLVHLYIFTFLIQLILFALLKLHELTFWNWISYLQGAILLYGIVYTIKAMKNFYGQRWGRTIFKFFLFNILALFSMMGLFSIFFLLTVFRL